MKDLRNQLTINKNGVSNLTDGLGDFSTDNTELTLTTSDYLLLGREAPFYSFFFYADTYNTDTSTTVQLEFYDDRVDDWTVIDEADIIDDTKGFTRSGFIQYFIDWEHWKEHTPFGNKSLHWLRLKVLNADTTAMDVRALNIIFSDDTELETQFSLINRSDFMLGRSDHVLTHVAVRNEIVQKFRNQGLTRYRNADNTNYDYRRIVAWDLLDIQEVRLAATHLALAKIFEAVSDSVDDKWRQKSRDHRKEYDKYISLAFITFDKSSDGDLNSRRQVNTVWLYR